jgi:hypothetical protein
MTSQKEPVLKVIASASTLYLPSGGSYTGRINVEIPEDTCKDITAFVSEIKKQKTIN